MVAYADASAIVKLVLVERGSPALHRWVLEHDRLLTSRVGAVETARAAARLPHDVRQLDAVIRALEIIELNEPIAKRAAAIQPTALRTLDAIHLSTALEIGPIDAFVTYDDRLAEAALLVGLPVVRPA
jgi:uncharacterized protein